MSYTQFQNKTNAFQIEAGNDGLNITTDLKKYSNVNEVTPDIQDVIQRYFTSTSSVRTATFYPAAADFNTTFNKRKCSYNELNNTSTINFNLQNADAAAIIPDGVNLYGVYAIACPHSTKTSVNFTMDMTTVVSNLSFINLLFFLPDASQMMIYSSHLGYLNLLKHNLKRLSILVFPYQVRFILLRCILSRLLNGMLCDAFLKFFFAL
jgi:hypothetical protein